MVKQKIYVIDIKKYNLNDVSTISPTDYTPVNAGTEMLINATSVGMVLGKATTVDTNLGRKDSAGLYQEGSVQHNSVSNRVYTITGVLDRSKNDGTIGTPVWTDRLTYLYLIQMVRSPSIFAMINELTIYSDNPQATYSGTTLGTNLTANQYQFVTFQNFSPMVRADDNNIIDYTIDAVLVND
jgi:hypothetical protein